jgi:hypothetical protein
VKRVFAATLLAALWCAAQAADVTRTDTPAAATALKLMPQRLGYAFEQPDILLRQRLFGLAHGLSLLAAACLDLPEHSNPIQDAYAAWHTRQAKTIETLVHDLAGHYFGPRADEAQWTDLAHALNLKDSILPSLGEVSLAAACASMPEAITAPRYELDKLLAQGIAPATGATSAAAAADVAPGAVAPAPTLPITPEKPAE